MNEELETLVAGVDAIAREAQARFGGLSAAQLNWKPALDAWSVAQCLEHLIKINSDYQPVIERIAREGHQPSLYERMPLLPGLFASMILKAVSPTAPRKFKAAAKFVPSASAIDGDIVARFVAHQQDVRQSMRSVSHLDLSKTIVTSPVASVAIYSLLDGFRIVVAHEQRHVAQAERVLSASGFPR